MSKAILSVALYVAIVNIQDIRNMLSLVKLGTFPAVLKLMLFDILWSILKAL